jgi:hypothetical protein
MAPQHLVEGSDLVFDLMPDLSHELLKAGKIAAKSRLLRLPSDLEVALAIARAIMGEAQEI